MICLGPVSVGSQLSPTQNKRWPGGLRGRGRRSVLSAHEMCGMRIGAAQSAGRSAQLSGHAWHSRVAVRPQGFLHQPPDVPGNARARVPGLRGCPVLPHQGVTDRAGSGGRSAGRRPVGPGRVGLASVPAAGRRRNRLGRRRGAAHHAHRRAVARQRPPLRYLEPNRRAGRPRSGGTRASRSPGRRLHRRLPHPRPRPRGTVHARRCPTERRRPLRATLCKVARIRGGGSHRPETGGRAWRSRSATPSSSST